MADSEKKFLVEYFQLPTQVWFDFLIQDSAEFFGYLIIPSLIFMLNKLIKIHLGILDFVYLVLFSFSVYKYAK